MNRVVRVLLGPPFLVALSLLLLNDFWGKAAWPGFVTGKLSDFAGIAMIALPLFAAFRRHVRAIYLGIAAAFLWWKSPVSAGFIAFANDVLPYPIARVVDYGDLAALLVLPFCARIAHTTSDESPGDARRRFAVPIALLAMFATAATSYAMPTWGVTIRNIDPAIELDRAATAETIAAVMKDWSLECRECAEPQVKGRYSDRDIYLEYHFPTPNSVHVRITADPGLYGDGETRRALRVRDAIKAAFTQQFKNLEAVEPLIDPRDWRWRAEPAPAPQ